MLQFYTRVGYGIKNTTYNWNIFSRILLQRTLPVVFQCTGMNATCTIKEKNVNELIETVAHIYDPISSDTLVQDAGRTIGKESLENFMRLYKDLSDPHEKRSFLLHLCLNYGCNQQRISSYCKSLAETTEINQSLLLKTQMNLKKQLTPQYCVLFTQLGSLENGVKFLTDLRFDALSEAKNREDRNEAEMFVNLSENLRDILSMWFSVGLLSLSQITWSTSANILEKVAKYEAVHAVRSWIDLKHRLGSYRRCYAFFHKSMPHEPLILLHVALTKEISSKIQDILEYKATTLELPTSEKQSEFSCAIFYSITSTQKGLQGIELGAYLIKAAVAKLRHELPHLTQFSSLSPIPGFHKWILKELNDGKIFELLTGNDLDLLNKALLDSGKNITLKKFLLEVLISGSFITNPELSLSLKDPLKRLCAIYICQSKLRGYALNSVANFHLKNGAVVWRINWMADKSTAGMRQSFSLMVNYRYYLDNMSTNSNNYLARQEIAVSDEVQKILPVAGDKLSSHL